MLKKFKEKVVLFWKGLTRAKTTLNGTRRKRGEIVLLKSREGLMLI
jgi:hypothetical protein